MKLTLHKLREWLEDIKVIAGIVITLIGMLSATGYGYFQKSDEVKKVAKDKDEQIATLANYYNPPIVDKSDCKKCLAFDKRKIQLMINHSINQNNKIYH